MGRKTSGRIAVVIGLAGVLSACASWPPGWQSSVPAQGSYQAATYFDFAWLLQGARQAAPLQVFDDSRRTWLQFSASQAQPRILAQVDEQWQATNYDKQGPYVVLDHVWPMLRVQVGPWEASVQKLEASTAQATNTTDTAPPMPPAVPSSIEIKPEGRAHHEIAPEASARSPEGDDVQVSQTQVPVAPTLVFAVHRADGHMRHALRRWAEQAGWIFLPEHWSVDVDIPISADAIFGASFEEAVQGLLAATDLSDRPLRPCFYANKVVRVVAYAQACDRSAKPERAA